MIHRELESREPFHRVFQSIERGAHTNGQQTPEANFYLRASLPPGIDLPNRSVDFSIFE